MKMILTLAFLAIANLLIAQSSAEKAIEAQLDRMVKSVHNKDFAGFKSFFTDDVAIYGTDPGEAPFETQAAMKSMKDLFAMQNVTYTYNLQKRDIIVHPGEQSAIAVEQGFHSILGKNLQARIVYYLVPKDGTWRCNFYSVAMIPQNEEMSKVDMALEKKPILEQKHDRTLQLMYANIITGIASAKKAGMSVADYAAFCGDKFATTWDKDAGFKGMVGGFMANLETSRRNQDPEIVILEQSDNKVVIKWKINSKDMFNGGPIFEVTHEDLLFWLDVVSQKIAVYLGASYQQKVLEGDWLQVTLMKN